MKIFDGENTVELARKKDCIQVQFTKTQYDTDALVIIREYAEATEIDNTLLVTYALPEKAINIQDMISQCRARLDKLQLADKISQLTKLEGKYRIPYIHPGNIFLDGEELMVVHFGLQNILTPMLYQQELLLRNIKALVLSIFKPELGYEKLLDGSIAIREKFSKTIAYANSPEEIFAIIRKELVDERNRVNKEKRLVSKGTYRFYQIAGAAALIAAIVSCTLLFRLSKSSEKQEAIIMAQSSFITNNYADTQSSLSAYSPNSLPKSAKYILAVSSINLTDLTTVQKENVLNNISTKSDDNTLDYWVYLGRGDFEQALNLAQNLGDDQLMLLAYTELYQATKLDTKMDGAKKQNSLEEYEKQINDLTKKIEEVQ